MFLVMNIFAMMHLSFMYTLFVATGNPKIGEHAPTRRKLTFASLFSGRDMVSFAVFFKFSLLTEKA